ncbi:MAG: hypothetical protein IJX23_00700 [Clostridia bacterium]|nr:hypothetical protein [Clostridia bacterium]
MKRIFVIALLLVMLFTLTSCGEGYVSSYRAVLLVRQNTTHSCSASFHSLTGTLVFKVKRTDDGEGAVNYSVKVTKGEIRLYYDSLGQKEELAVVTAGQTVNTSGGYVEKGYRVYVIIEATEDTQGEVSVELNG